MNPTRNDVEPQPAGADRRRAPGPAFILAGLGLLAGCAHRTATMLPPPAWPADQTPAADDDGNESFWPYLRDDDTYARPWAIPGTPGLMHRVGGLEKQDGTGNIDYTPENHERMGELRAAKIAAIAADIPPTEIHGDADGDVLVLGWGSTWAAIDAAVQRTRRRGNKVASAHIVHLNPLPPDLGDIMRRYSHVIVPELNSGQLSNLLRGKYLVDVKALTKVQGLPFKSREIEAAIEEAIASITSTATDQKVSS